MERISLSDFPGTLDRIYRAALPMVWVESREANTAIEMVWNHKWEGNGDYNVLVVGAGRPLRHKHTLPTGFPTLENWAQLSELAALQWDRATLVIVTGYPVDDMANDALYRDILLAYMHSAGEHRAPVLLVMMVSAVPTGYSRLGPVLRVAAPNSVERRTYLSNLALKNGVHMDDETLDSMAMALSGLEVAEIREIGLLQLLERRSYDPADAALMKAQRLANGGLLDIIPPTEAMTDVGGLEGLKHWLVQRRQAFSSVAQEFGLPKPKGVLLVGPPGTGKSLAAKAVASAWGFPLVRLDMGRVYGSYVGESEKNLRTALFQLEEMAPAICWIDEIEKGFSGMGTGGNEISRRLLQTLLTFMQEQAGLFFFLTANDVGALPPELVRKGRVDELFWVDLPDDTERASILQIHLTRRHRNPALFDMSELVTGTDGFSGSELEAAIVDALHIAFSEGREVTTRDIADAIGSTRPLSALYPEQIDSIRHWGHTHARPAGSVGNQSGEAITFRLKT